MYTNTTAEAQNAPELSFSGTGTYLAVCLDVDAPFASLPVLGPIMHWIQPGYKADASGKLVTTDPVVASYIGPAPPPLASPHRYVFFIYEQPADFDASLHKLSPQEPPPVTKRMFYNIGTLEEKAKLGPILAVNYFVSN